MKLFRNTTSPYARIASITLQEKGYERVQVELVNPWADPADLIAVNTASRVPALVLDDGTVLTESLLIVMWAERDRPEPPLLGANPAAALSVAGIAMGIIDAAVHTLVGRVITSGVPTDKAFDELPVGLRRRRSMTTGLARLDARLADLDGAGFDVAVMTSIVALDYVDFRFPAAPWLPELPRLRSLRAAHAERSSIADTVPHD